MKGSQDGRVLGRNVRKKRKEEWEKISGDVQLNIYLTNESMICSRELFIRAGETVICSRERVI
jgi:predicted NAD-dependent protein-ADP-ribosyltransferase YbiA (DUF1768 family)